MARIIDTTPEFDAFARRAFLESPVGRERLWRERYQGAHREVFEAFRDSQTAEGGLTALVRELSGVRRRVLEAAPVTRELIEELEPAVREVLGVAPEPAPQHVLLVGGMATNAAVGRLRGDVTLFHCLEWFRSREGAAVVVSHEDAHAWHQIALAARAGDGAADGPPSEDAAWTAFSEGVAIHASRLVVPGRDEADYFWYGHAGFEDWLPWCRERRDDLLRRFAAALGDPAAADTWFGSGLVDGQWRVGYFVADEAVGRLGLALPELVAMSVEAGREAIRDALGAG